GEAVVVGDGREKARRVVAPGVHARHQTTGFVLAEVFYEEGVERPLARGRWEVIGFESAARHYLEKVGAATGISPRLRDETIGIAPRLGIDAGMIDDAIALHEAGVVDQERGDDRLAGQRVRLILPHHDLGAAGARDVFHLVVVAEPHLVQPGRALDRALGE